MGYKIINFFSNIPLETEAGDFKLISRKAMDEILKLRDDAFIDYHTNPKFLDRIQKRFGDNAVKNIKEMSKIKLTRKIVEDNLNA